MSDSGFYRAFEERYRGSRELIMQRATAYRAYIEPLLKIYQPAFLQDLGCGRGEWLEYTEELGFVTHGVDLDEDMLQACIERDLPVTKTDAVSHLKSLADNSQNLVSGFHIAEHIPFDELQQLIKEALRVLKPGGLLILETPNPENLVVGTNNFYMDPTHQRPIPPLLLSFVAEYTGFSRVKILRLQESPELANGSTEPALIDVLGGASPDYAIVAQKVAKRSLMADFDAAFAEQQGLTLDVLAQRYDEKTSQQLDALAQRLAELAETEQVLNQQQAQQHQELKTELGERLQLLTENLTQRLSAIADTERALNQQQAQQHQELKTELGERLQLLTESLLKEQNQREQGLTSQLQNALDLLKQAQRISEQAKAEQITAEQKAIAALQEANDFQLQLTALESELKQTRQELHNTHQSNHFHWQQGEERQQQIEALQQELHNLHQANHHHWQLTQDQLQQLEHTTEQLNQSLGNAHNWYLRATAAEQQIQNFLHSSSWRLTAPLRGLKRLLIWLLLLPWNMFKFLLRPIAKTAIGFVVKRPGLHARLSKRLKPYPRLFAHLRRFAINRSVLPIPQQENGDFKLNADLIDDVKKGGWLANEVDAPESIPDEPISTSQERVCDDVISELFESFVNRVFAFDINSDLFLAAIKKVSGVGHECVFEQLCDQVGAELNFHLIESLRCSEHLVFKSDLSPKDLPNINKLVIHVYLALLRRYPSDSDVERLAGVILKNNDVESVIRGIKSSEEFKKIGYRRI